MGIGADIRAKGAALAVLGLVALAAPAARAAEGVRLPAAAELLPVAQQTLTDGTGSPLSLAPAPRRTLQLDSNNRWGFRLDLEQPSSRDQDFRDIQAGAYLRFGKQLRVGGSVGFGPSPAASMLRPADPAPRVRLESNFKF